MSIESQIYGRYSAAADKAQTLDQLKAIQNDIYKATQSGVLHPVEGVPLVQSLTPRIQQAEAAQQQALMMQYAPQVQGMPQGMPQGQPAPAPIAPQIMAQAQQLSGVDNLRSNLPAEEGYAAGGIIAFAGGNLVDAEDDSYTEDDREEANLMSLMDMARARIRSGIAAVPRAYEAVKAAVPQSYERALAEQPATARTTTTVEGGLSGLLGKAAAKHSLPTELLQRIAGSESGGNVNAANPRSSAKGVFQFTDATWRGMGGKEGEQFNPETNVDLGAKFVRQNAEGLKNALGRNPTYGEVYASHFFGLQGAKDLMRMDPRTPINQAVSSQVIKANPNLRGKTIGEVLGNLQSKMGEGIVALAQGGPIAFAGKDGSLVNNSYFGEPEDVYSPEGILVTGAGTMREAEKPEWEKEWERKYLKPTIPVSAPVPATASLNKYDPINASQEGFPMEGPTPVAPEVPPVVVPGTQQAEQPEIKDPYLQKYMDMLQKRETESVKQKETDKYLALLQAGLGMMGGTSPYAMVNIGQGATQGVGALMAANKQRAAEEAATLSGYGKLYTAKQAADLKRELTGQNKELAYAKIDQDKSNKLTQQVGYVEKALDNQAAANVKIALGTGFNDLDPQQRAAMVNAEAQRLKSISQPLKRLYKELGMPELETTPAAAAIPDYNKLYGLKPKQ